MRFGASGLPRGVRKAKPPKVLGGGFGGRLPRLLPSGDASLEGFGAEAPEKSVGIRGSSLGPTNGRIREDFVKGSVKGAQRGFALDRGNSCVELTLEQFL